jgi:hypothetical protein
MTVTPFQGCATLESSGARKRAYARKSALPPSGALPVRWCGASFRGCLDADKAARGAALLPSGARLRSLKSL